MACRKDYIGRRCAPCDISILSGLIQGSDVEKEGIVRRTDVVEALVSHVYGRESRRVLEAHKSGFNACASDINSDTALVLQVLYLEETRFIRSYKEIFFTSCRRINLTLTVVFHS